MGCQPDTTSKKLAPPQQRTSFAPDQPSGLYLTDLVDPMVSYGS